MSDKPYRTIELDYDARRRPKTDRSCVRCQRDIKPSAPVRGIHVIEGGISILHPADESKYIPDNGDCGFFILGMDCARIVGMEWTSEAN
jgi:hypothetical protein